MVRLDEGRVEKSKVKLIKNKLILDQLYSTLFLLSSSRFGPVEHSHIPI